MYVSKTSNHFQMSTSLVGLLRRTLVFYCRYVWELGSFMHTFLNRYPMLHLTRALRGQSLQPQVGRLGPRLHSLRDVRPQTRLRGTHPTRLGPQDHAWKLPPFARTLFRQAQGFCS